MAVDEAFLRIVRDDLEYLVTEWRPEVTDVSLRMTGTVLRRLLIEGGIQRAWKATGFPKQPVISGPDFAAMLGTIDGEVLCALAGGATSASTGTTVTVRFPAMVQGGVIRFTTTEPEARSIAETDTPCYLSDFVEAPIALTHGEFINRRQLIQYVCYKKGAVHYDGEAKRNQQPNRDQLRVTRRLDELDQLFNLDGRSGVFFEFLGVGQQVASAEDIGRLMAVLRKV